LAFGAQRFNRELVFIVSVQVLKCPGKHAATQKKLLLGLSEKVRFPGKIGPFGPLPVPCHDR
jgi:hypothetical protein